MSEIIEEKIAELEKALGAIELDVATEGITLSSLMREGTRVTGQAVGWGDGENACALSAGWLALKARKLI